MAKKKQKSFSEKIPNWIWAVVIAGGIGLFFGYSDASIHVWGTALGMWILMILYELIDLKKQLKK